MKERKRELWMSRVANQKKLYVSEGIGESEIEELVPEQGRS